METVYRPLEEGEALEIGDEYRVEDDWVILSEEDYAQWVTAYSHYHPSWGMRQFRRPLDKDMALVSKTQSIYDRVASNVVSQ